VVEWDPLNLAQSVEKLAADAAPSPGLVGRGPWEERRAPFATLSCHILPLGEPEGPGRFFIQTGGK
jgi:hypothetical protein